MKKILLLFTFLSAFTFITKAQEPISLSWDGEVLGDTAVVFGAPNNLGELIFHAVVHNNTDNGMNIMAARTNIDVIGGTQNSFCWFTCWSHTVDTSGNYIFIPAGGQSADDEFSGHYNYNDSLGNPQYGTSIIKYSFFSVDDYSIIDTIYVKYVLGYTGLGENNYNGATVSDIFPNPASSTAFIDYKLSNNVSQGEIKIINLVGKTVKTIPISEREGRLKIDVSKFSKGIYFYSVSLDGNIVKTKKFMVKK